MKTSGKTLNIQYQQRCIVCSQRILPGQLYGWPEAGTSVVHVDCCSKGKS